jgi:hypothetical protein
MEKQLYQRPRRVKYKYDGTIKALVPLMHRAVAQEHALSEPKGELMVSIWAQVGPTGATKSTKSGVVGLFIEEKF